jgi:UDP-N-acetylmuramate dehydrogenase
VPGYPVIKQTACQNSDGWIGFVQYGSSSLKTHLRALRDGSEPEVHERVDLRAWTALGVGGPADLLIRCRSADGLQRVIDLLTTHGQPWLVLGAGSRLVPPGGGLRVPVINLSGNLALWELDLDGAVAGGGANLAQVCRAAARTGLSGMEAMFGTGSSVGGAVHAAIHDLFPLPGLVDWVDVCRPGRPVERIQPGLGNGGLEFDLERRVVLGARFQLAGHGASNQEPRPNAARPSRLQRIPRSTAPCFVGPVGSNTDDLLREAECPGMVVGGVRMSRRFPNRICASRSARPSDVAQLTRGVQGRVEDRMGVVLQPALCFVDENGTAVEP